MPLHFASPWLLLFLPVGVAYVLWARRKSYVNLPPSRRQLSTFLRALLVLVLTLAVARPVLIGRSRFAPLVLLVDVSRSVSDEQLEAERAFARQVWEARGNRAVEVVSFAGHPRRVAVGEGGPTIARHDEDDTDFAEAIAFARGLVPERAPLIVLLSDGNDPRGQARQAIERAAAEGVIVDVAKLPARATVDARVVAIRVPEVVRRQEATRFTIIASATRPGRAAVRLQENGFLVKELPSVALTGGSQAIDIDFSPTVAGLVRYGAEVSLAGDSVPGNDRFVQLVSVGGPPRVLLVAATPEEGMHLEEALSAQEMTVEAVSPGSLPSTLEALLPYDEVIVAGVAPWEIDPLRQGTLASYVRDTGGGLIFVSGRRGLTRDPEGKPSPLESVLPVELAQPSEKQEPPVAIVMLVDRSSSMVGVKLDNAKRAARAVVDKLSPNDQLGVIAFDAAFEWIVPLRRLDDKAAVKEAIGTLGAGGGTRFYPPMEEAYFTLGSADATVRHILLLTDGVSTDPVDVFPPLLEKARAGSITVSAVAIGREADAKLLGDIARRGGGRFSIAVSASDVPDLFLKETETIQRDAAQRVATTAHVALAARELGGIDFSTAPPLLGYLRTRAKATAEVLLDTPRDPLLVRWRYGIGQVVAWSSDATAAWGERWIGWSGFGKLWAQIARATQRSRAKRDLQLTLRESGEQVELTVDAIDAESHLLDELEVKARVIDGADQSHEITLPQVAPGRYATAMPLTPGSLLARPFASRGGRRLDGDWAILPRPYPRELAAVGVDAAALASLATAGRGQLVAEPREIVAPAPLPRTVPLTTPLALAALALFLADLYTKRARWTRRA